MRKVVPGTYSLLEPGWWVVHVLTIFGAIMLGMALERRA